MPFDQLTPAVLVCLAYALDRLLGEPGRAHPLVAFGRLASWLENHLHSDSSSSSANRQRVRGTAAALIAATAATLGVSVLVRAPAPWLGDGYEQAMSVLVLYLCLGGRALNDAGRHIAAALDSGMAARARGALDHIVSRDTEWMELPDVAVAAVESIVENGNDAVIAPLFWFLVAGVEGAVLHRALNTLDAMWGYRNDRYLHFGWAAARADDWVGWIPARLTGLGYAMAGSTKAAFSCWRSQARTWKSRNAGATMAAGAGALGVSVGGRSKYHGQWQMRPTLGCGPRPEAADVRRACALVTRAALVLLFVVLAAQLAGGWLLP